MASKVQQVKQQETSQTEAKRRYSTQTKAKKMATAETKKVVGGARSIHENQHCEIFVI